MVSHRSHGSLLAAAKILSEAARNASIDSHIEIPTRRSPSISRHPLMRMRPSEPAAAASTRRIDARTSSLYSGFGWWMARCVITGVSFADGVDPNLWRGMGRVVEAERALEPQHGRDD